MAYAFRAPLTGFHLQAYQSCNELAFGTIGAPCVWNYLKKKASFDHRIVGLQVNAVSGDGEANTLSEAGAQNWSPVNEGSADCSSSKQGNWPTSAEILKQLKRYGVSGILAYGILNTAYYSMTFLLVWFYFAPAPGKMGYLAAMERFFKVMAMVWAGSQVTKIVRAAGALALAPFVDTGLTWFTERFHFESRGKAFLTVVGFCLGLAVILFLGVTFLSA